MESKDEGTKKESTSHVNGTQNGVNENAIQQHKSGIEIHRDTLVTSVADSSVKVKGSKGIGGVFRGQNEESKIENKDKERSV